MRWAGVIVVLAAAAFWAPAGSARETPHLQNALREVRGAILAEQTALADLAKSKPDWKQVAQHTFTGETDLFGVNSEVSLAAKNGEITDAEATAFYPQVQGLIRLDKGAFGAAEAKNAAKVRAQIRETLPVKHELEAKIQSFMTNASVKRCEVEKPFQVFAIPSGFAGSYADVFPHDIPKDAKNVKVSFVDLATGKAPGPEVFPGQTWTFVNKGYQANGKYDVHVDVSGTGFGKPNANVKNWKVVVTFDCP